MNAFASSQFMFAAGAPPAFGSHAGMPPVQPTRVMSQQQVSMRAASPINLRTYSPMRYAAARGASPARAASPCAFKTRATPLVGPPPGAQTSMAARTPQQPQQPPIARVGASPAGSYVPPGMTPLPASPASSYVPPMVLQQDAGNLPMQGVPRSPTRRDSLRPAASPMRGRVMSTSSGAYGDGNWDPSAGARPAVNSVSVSGPSGNPGTPAAYAFASAPGIMTPASRSSRGVRGYVVASAPAARAVQEVRAASPIRAELQAQPSQRCPSPIGRFASPIRGTVVPPINTHAIPRADSKMSSGASGMASPMHSVVTTPSLAASFRQPRLSQGGSARAAAEQRCASPMDSRRSFMFEQVRFADHDCNNGVARMPGMFKVEPTWAVDQTCQIGRDREEVADLIGPDVRMLDMDMVTSVGQAVDGLNSGAIHCPEQCCIVFSRNSKGFYLLYRKGEQDVALGVLQTVQAKAKGKHQALQVGAIVRIGEHGCRITGPLGKGSFGIVWAAEIQDSPSWKGSVAVKEMQCSCKYGAAAQAREGELLQDLIDLRSQRFGNGDAPVHDAFGWNPLDRVPALVAVETKNSGTDLWQVRLAMTRVPGIPLDRYLEQRRLAHAKYSPLRRFAESCDIALELLEQLVPTFELMSSALLHRDVNAHNILVHEALEDGDGRGAAKQQRQAWGFRRPRLRFGLVDFGLAVRRRDWDGPVGPSSWHLVDIGGDCRYWPMGAWLQFECGCDELSKYPQLASEYQAQLDLHALGLTALQIVAAAFSPSAEAKADGDEVTLQSAELDTMRDAWERYWEDATEYWERLLNVFRYGGDQFALKASCIEDGVHNIVGARLATVRSALRDAELSGALLGKPERKASRNGLSDEVVLTDSADADIDEALRNRTRPLLAGLLEMVSAGGVVGIDEKIEPSSWQAVRAAIST